MRGLLGFGGVAESLGGASVDADADADAGGVWTVHEVRSPSIWSVNSPRLTSYVVLGSVHEQRTVRHSLQPSSQ